MLTKTKQKEIIMKMQILAKLQKKQKQKKTLKHFARIDKMRPFGKFERNLVSIIEGNINHIRTTDEWTPSHYLGF